VFGKVLRGYAEVVERIAQVAVDAKHRPASPVVVTNCGELEMKKKSAPATIGTCVQLRSHRRTEVCSALDVVETDSKKERRKKRRDGSNSRSQSPDKKRERKHKSKRRRSTPPGDARGAPVDPEAETEEQLDARLEREEKDRIAARRQRELAEIKRQQEERAARAEGGVRFKGKPHVCVAFAIACGSRGPIGRGRMRYVDPEMHSGSRSE
jgi:peptidyl-prolyl isomerase G (cyclophilin G)